MEWQVTLPCLPAMVPVVRRLARGLITDCPRTDDAELILSELSGNTVRWGVGALSITLAVREGWSRSAISSQLTVWFLARVPGQGLLDRLLLPNGFTGPRQLAG